MKILEKQKPCEAVLIVEDDEAIQEAIRYLLEMEGYSVMSAFNGKEALDLLASTPARPCLILLDLMLPIMDGWEFLEVLRSQTDLWIAALPVVITSAAGNAALTASQRAQGFIRKPIDFELLLMTVKKHCG